MLLHARQMLLHPSHMLGHERQMLLHDKQLLQHAKQMLFHDKQLLQHGEQMLRLDKQLLGLLVDLLRLVQQLQLHGARMKLQALRCHRHVKQLLQHVQRLHGPSKRQLVRESGPAGHVQALLLPVSSAQGSWIHVVHSWRPIPGGTIADRASLYPDRAGREDIER
jgi:hypothetical protein